MSSLVLVPCSLLVPSPHTFHNRRYVVRKNADAATDDERGRLEVVGEYHTGVCGGVRGGGRCTTQVCVGVGGGGGVPYRWEERRCTTQVSDAHPG